RGGLGHRQSVETAGEACTSGSLLLRASGGGAGRKFPVDWRGTGGSPRRPGGAGDGHLARPASSAGGGEAGRGALLAAPARLDPRHGACCRSPRDAIASPASSVEFGSYGVRGRTLRLCAPAALPSGLLDGPGKPCWRPCASISARTATRCIGPG